MSIEINGNKIIIPIEIALEDKEELAKIKSDLEGMVQKTGGTKSEAEGGMSAKAGLALASRAVSSPLGLATSELAALAPLIIEALIAAGLLKTILDYLQSPGGPIDVRFRREMQTEMFGEFSIQEQQARRIGEDQVIITSFDGFRNHNGANVANSFRQLRQLGHTTAGMLDKAKGGSVVTL